MDEILQLEKERRKAQKALTADHVRERTAEKGWQLEQIVAIESIIRGRWALWAAILANEDIGPPDVFKIPPLGLTSSRAGGETPDTPVELTPWQRRMIGSRHEARSHWHKTLDFVTGRGVHLPQVFEWLLWAYGSASVERRPDLPDAAEVAMYKFEPQRMIAHACDWASDYAVDYYGRQKAGNAWFPTPVDICVLTTQMMTGADPDEDTRALTINEPCCGTGVMLLAASDYSLDLSAQDVDRSMCLMCETQGYWYIPWLVRGDKSKVRGLNGTERRRHPAEALISLLRGDLFPEPEDTSQDENGSDAAAQETRYDVTRTQMELF
jgi:hypothetical protein